MGHTHTRYACGHHTDPETVRKPFVVIGVGQRSQSDCLECSVPRVSQFLSSFYLNQDTFKSTLFGVQLKADDPLLECSQFQETQRDH